MLLIVYGYLIDLGEIITHSFSILLHIQNVCTFYNAYYRPSCYLRSKWTSALLHRAFNTTNIVCISFIFGIYVTTFYNDLSNASL